MIHQMKKMTFRSKPLDCVNTAVKLTSPKNRFDHEEIVSYIGNQLGHSCRHIAEYFNLKNQSTIIYKIRKARSEMVKNRLYKKRVKEAEYLLGLNS